MTSFSNLVLAAVLIAVRAEGLAPPPVQRRLADQAESTSDQDAPSPLVGNPDCPQYDNNKRSLLIVDIQNDFISGSLATPNADSVIGPTNTLREEGTFDDITLSMDSHPNGHVSFGSAHGKPMTADNINEWGTEYKWADPNGIEKSQLLWPDHCVYNSDGWKNPDSLVMGANDHWIFKGTDVLRDSYSAFFDNDQTSETELHAHLQSKEIKDLVIAGLVFDVCVKSTALDAIEKGYRVYVASDATVAFGDWEQAENELKEKGVRIGTVDEYLLNPAGAFNCPEPNADPVPESSPAVNSASSTAGGVLPIALSLIGAYLFTLV